MKYKLLKDTPTVKAGMIGELKMAFNEEGYVFKKQDGEIFFFMKNVVESQPDWFEPVIDRWRAFENSDFYVVNNYLDVVNFTEEKSHGDNRLFDAGNYFKKRDQAEEASRRIKKVLMDYHKEIGE